jgi:hypothetical protein
MKGEGILLTKLGVKARSGFKNIAGRIKDSLNNKRGDAVVWVVIIILCVIIGVSVFNKYGGAGADVGSAIDSMGGRASTGLSSVTVVN